MPSKPISSFKSYLPHGEERPIPDLHPSTNTVFGQAPRSCSGNGQAPAAFDGSFDPESTLPAARRSTPAHAFPTSQQRPSVLAAFDGIFDAPSTLSTAGASAFSTAPRFPATEASSAFDGVFDPELPRALRPRKPAAHFGSAAARPRRPLEDDTREDLEPDAALLLKPRSASAMIAPPPEAADAKTAPMAHLLKPPVEPGPGTYEIKGGIDLIHKRAPTIPAWTAPSAKRQPSPPRHPTPPPPEEPSATTAEKEQLPAPFNSSAPRKFLLDEYDDRGPLDPMLTPVKKTAPAFSFGGAPTDRGGYSGYDYYDEGGDGSMMEWEDEGGEAPPPVDEMYKVIEKRAPSASFGTARRWKEEEPAEAAEEADDESDAREPTAMTTPRRMTKGGVIGRAPRFKPDTPSRGADTTPFSPTASTILSDAATDIATLDDVEEAGRNIKPRVIGGIINPERTVQKSRAAIWQAQLAERRGPGRYHVETDLIDKRKLPSSAFAPPSTPTPGATPTSAHGEPPTTPVTEGKTRFRRRKVETPGPGAYAHVEVTPPKVIGGASWAKMCGRDESEKKKQKGGSKEEEEKEEAKAKALEKEAKAKQEKEKVKAPAPAPPKGVGFGSGAARMADGTASKKRRAAAGQDSKAAAGNPFAYDVKYDAVERSAKGGSWGTKKTAEEISKRRLASKRIELLRGWRMRRNQIDKMLRGEFTEGLAAPADVTRRSLQGFKFSKPAKVGPPNKPTNYNRHRAVPPGVARNPPLKHPEVGFKLTRPNAESYSFGKAAARIGKRRKIVRGGKLATVEEEEYEDEMGSPGPATYSLSALEAKFQLAMWRSPSAVWSRLTSLRLMEDPFKSDDEDDREERHGLDEIALARGRGYKAALRRRRKAQEAMEGDVLILNLLKNPTRWSLAPHLPGFRMLLPQTTPRKALVPRPPWPPPPLPPVLLLPPNKLRHIPALNFAPNTHRDHPRIGEYGPGVDYPSDGALADVPMLS